MQAELERCVRERDTCSQDFRILRPNGTVRWLRGKGKPFFTGAGDLSYVTGAAIDITARRDAEARMRLLAHALQSANDCITISDTEGRLLYVNEAFLRTYEYTEEEILGQPVSILRSGDTEDAVLQAMNGATRRKGWCGEIWNRSKSGRVLPVDLATSMVRDEQGRIIAAVGVARDVTVRNELETQVRQAQKMDAVGRLAAGVAHDFNNLITVILMNCEEGRTSPDLQPSLRRRLDEIHVASEAAASLTRQLLAVSG